MTDCRTKGWLPLCLAAAAVSIIWLAVLPQIGSWTLVRRRIERLQRIGVDPSALFYTDLESMPRLEADIAETRRSHPDAFWSLKPDAK